MRRLQAFALVLALTIVFALTTVTAMAQVPPGLMRAAIAAQERHIPQLLANPDVVGTAIGLEGNEPVVKVLLKRDGVRGLPGHVDGFRVVPFVTGEIFALGKPGTGGVDRTARWRPAPIGVSTGHPDITAGTIGCRVTDGTNVYALSNNHVYANENLADIGDNVLQPGPYDGGKDTDYYRIGTLSDFEHIQFAYGLGNPDAPVNTIDAAIALSSVDLLLNETPSDGYGLPKSTPIEMEAIGMNVMKYGRTTGLTKGKIDSINATLWVSYEGGYALFSNQIIITPGKFSAGGDSGSLIVVNDVTVVGKGKNATVNEGPDHLKPVGLLFAGSNVVTIANRIQDVLTRFGVTVDGE